MTLGEIHDAAAFENGGRSSSPSTQIIAFNASRMLATALSSISKRLACSPRRFRPFRGVSRARDSVFARFEARRPSCAAFFRRKYGASTDRPTFFEEKYEASTGRRALFRPALPAGLVRERELGHVCLRIWIRYGTRTAGDLPPGPNGALPQSPGQAKRSPGWAVASSVDPERVTQHRASPVRLHPGTRSTRPPPAPCLATRGCSSRRGARPRRRSASRACHRRWLA